MSEPLLLVPGMMCDARVFWHQIVTLSSEVSIHLGQISKGGTLEEMAQAVLADAPERFALAGLGLGGNVALEVLRRAPERVARIALISTSPLAEAPQAAAAREARIVGALAGRLAAVMEEELPAAALYKSELRDEIVAHVKDMALNMGEGAFVRQSRVMQRRPDQQKTLRKALIPALVIAGAVDTIVAPRRQEFMSELMPYAKFHCLEEAGHLPTMEAPEQVTEALREWLKGPLMLR